MAYFNYLRRTLPPLVCVCVNSLGNIHAAGKHGDTTLSVSIPLTLSEFFLVSEEKMTRKYHMTTSEQQQQQCYYSRFWYEIIMGRGNHRGRCHAKQVNTTLHVHYPIYMV